MKTLRTLFALLALAIAFPSLAADTAISALPAASTLVGTETFPGVQGTATVKITPAQVRTYMLGTTGTWSGLTAGTATVAVTAQTATNVVSTGLPALTGDVTMPAGSTATTLATVNSNTGTFTLATVTVNAKGQITAASSGSGGSGTVQSVGIAGSNGIGVTSSPITTTGTMTLSLGAITPSSVSTGSMTTSALVSSGNVVMTLTSGQTVNFGNTVLLKPNYGFAQFVIDVNGGLAAAARQTGFVVNNSGGYGFNASSIDNDAVDTRFTRNAAKVVELNSGVAGTYPGTALVLGPQTVAQLPACAAGKQGARATVTDASATTFLSTVAGSGANIVPVMCNGTNWVIGEAANDGLVEAQHLAQVMEVPARFYQALAANDPVFDQRHYG